MRDSAFQSLVVTLGEEESDLVWFRIEFAVWALVAGERLLKMSVLTLYVTSCFIVFSFCLTAMSLHLSRETDCSYANKKSQFIDV